MSYCVNCESSFIQTFRSRSCFAKTPVFHPDKEPENIPSAFPENRGQVDVVKHRDLAIFLSIVLGSTAITCGLLNLFIFDFSLWSFPIIGICVLLWVFAIPAVIYTKLTLYWSFFFDGIVVVAYLYMLTWLTNQTPADRAPTCGTDHIITRNTSVFNGTCICFVSDYFIVYRD